MPLYEIIELETMDSRGVYFYEDEKGLVKFMNLLPEIEGGFAYHEITPREKDEVEKAIKEELRQEEVFVRLLNMVW